MLRSSSVLLTSLLLILTGGARAAPLILNEYNAVGAIDWLNGGDPNADAGGGFAQDTFFGRIQGNGGDWFELAVVANGLDVRGWELEICELGSCNAPLVFAAHPVWADLRAGTIITVGENLASDVSYDPNAGDWWIHVQAANSAPGTYITADSFPVSNDDWQLTIRDALGQLVFGPAGEGIAAGVGVNRREVFKLETAPSAIVTPASTFYDDGFDSSFGSPNPSGGGVSVQDFSALRTGLPLPDRDGDGVPADGDRSGWAGDTPCSAGFVESCDDNCPLSPNPLQTDTGSMDALPADGIGDACQCGDALDDGVVTSADAAAIRQALTGLDPPVFDAAKCAVVNDGACTIADVAVILRQVDGLGLGPPLAPICEAAAGPVDPTEKMFDPNHVLEVEITLDPNDWDTLRNQTRTILDVIGGDCFAGPREQIFTFFPGTVSVDGIVLHGVGVRKKGLIGSLDSHRPSLKIDFSEYASGQRVHGLDRMTLNNDRQDPSHVKQCLGYSVFRAAGLPAPRCSFAHVTVNSEDLGVYTHVESIKKPFLRRHFASGAGNLYEGTLSDFRPVWVNTFDQKTNASDPNRADLQAVVDALEVPDASLVTALEPLLDLDAFYTFWAVEGIIGHWDGYQGNRNNFWIYFDPTSGQMQLIPWGIDSTFANGGGLAAIRPRAMLTRRLYLNPPTQAIFIARLTELLETVWDAAALQADIDRMEAMLTPYDPGLALYTPEVRAWIGSRKDDILLLELGGGPPVWTEALEDPVCIVPVGPFSASFDTSWDTLDAPGIGGSLSVPPSLSPPITLTMNAAGPSGPALGTIRILGFRADGDVTLLNVERPLPELQVGTWPLGEAFEAILLDVPVQTGGQTEVLGYVVDGTLTITAAGTAPGAAVTGSMSGTVGVFTIVTE